MTARRPSNSRPTQSRFRRALHRGGTVVVGMALFVSLQAETHPRPTSAEEPVKHPSEVSRFVLETVRGRVVFMGEALRRRQGIELVAEAMDRTLALETPDGQIWPLVEDVRGRAFRRDPRLRAMNVELLVRRYRETPVLQVLNVYSVEKDGRYEIDYWCDVCAIAMFELKPCECCQADIELRRRKDRGEP